MKKLALIGIVCLTTLVSFTSTKNIIGEKENSNKLEIKNTGCNYGQCMATSKATGERCRNCAQKDSYYCWSHNHQ
jgi:hypothetical protein